MPDPFRYVRPGEDLIVPATAYNAFIDSALEVMKRQHDITAGDLAQVRQGDIVKVKNESGDDLPMLSVLGLDGPIFTPDVSLIGFLQAVTFRGVVPDSTHYGRFCVLLEPAAAGQVVRGWVSGVCIVKLDMASPAYIFADIVEGDTTKLRGSGGGAAQVLWKEYDQGEPYGAYDDPYGPYEDDWQWAVVRLGPKSGQPLHFLAPSEGIPARTSNGYGGYTPGSAECQVMQAVGDGDVDFTGIATIYNDSDIDVSSDAEGWAVWGDDGRPYAITEYCPDPYA